MNRNQTTFATFSVVGLGKVQCKHGRVLKQTVVFHAQRSPFHHHVISFFFFFDLSFVLFCFVFFHREKDEADLMS